MDNNHFREEQRRTRKKKRQRETHIHSATLKCYIVSKHVDLQVGRLLLACSNVLILRKTQLSALILGRTIWQP